MKRIWGSHFSFPFLGARNSAQGAMEDSDSLCGARRWLATVIWSFGLPDADWSEPNFKWTPIAGNVNYCDNIIVQARKSEKSLSKRLVPFSESEKSLQVLNTAQTKQFGQKNSSLHAHEVRKKTTIDWLLWNNFIGTVERIILLHHVCKPSWVCVDVDPKEVYFFQDLVIYCTKTTDWKGYTK